MASTIIAHARSHRPTRLRRTLKLALTGAALVVLGPFVSGCDKPCEELELKVCNDLQWERKCEMLQEPDRRERLIGETCSSILKHLKR